MIDYRTEDIAPYLKPLSSYTIQRKFMKENSVFDDWQEDDKVILSKVKDDIFANWKFLKIKMDDIDRKKLVRVIDQHISMLKHIFTWLQSSSESYPGVS